ncbi:pentatricopeptide repeat domain-containing protein (PPR motif) [Cognatiyoonia sediminum]|uniref:Pentatricopeptide repeat domain-containing protein (PPR motif) n=1 Tax=Cognatiyoonia sediminum TaxID=1508389 RepID=A0A1M5L5T7_9RHOB|nr:tetratricopeptide repeat protein [Cognatiyoonia sediminum]SHG60336.1 pentatricopeptide repeat domain-containing protein (PPR motif) [Cognatiyoonia sediminum]
MKADEPAKKQLDALVKLLDRGRDHDALSRAARLSRKYPDNLFVLNIIASAYGKLGEHDKAIRVFESIRSRDPEIPQLHHNLAISFFRTGRLNEATTAMKEAVRLDPLNTTLQSNLGAMYLVGSDVMGARDAFAAAAQLAPDSPDAQWNFERMERAARNLRKAALIVEDALHENPNDPVLLCKAGSSYSHLGDPKSAMKYFQRSRELDPDSPELYFHIGQFWKKNKQMGKAVQAFERATELNPSYSDAFAQIGSILKKAGHTDRAINCYERVLEISPENVEVAHFLSAMKGETTDTAPAQYVTDLFDSYASRFEANLVGDLEYRGPEVLRKMLDAALSDGARFKAGIDLGCGTGLSGMAFRDVLDHLAGVDLSANMVGLAEEKGVYDRLTVSDVVSAISDSDVAFDFFLSTDVFVYVGDLEDLFAAVRENAAQGALFVFSTEDLEEGTFALLPSGRYAHSRDYIAKMCDRHDMKIVDFGRHPLRMEFGKMLVGGYYILRT